MKFAEYLIEVASKDWDRMQTLINKNSDGAGVAKTIKDKTKAIDRYIAGLKLSGTELNKPPFEGKFADFGNRALELGATYADIKKVYDQTDVNDYDRNNTTTNLKGKTETKAPVEDVWVPKSRTSDQAPMRASESRGGKSPILSLGSLNLKTGECTYFNVYETWGENTTYELWDMGGGKLRICATSGKEPIFDIGDGNLFIGDQSRRDLGHGILIDWATGSDLKHMAKKYGTRIPAYTYK